MLNQAIRSRIRSVAFCMQKLRSVIPPLWLLILLTNGRLSPVVYLSMQRMLTKRIKEPSIMEPKALWNHLIRNMGALVASKIHVATHGGLHPHRLTFLCPESTNGSEKMRTACRRINPEPDRTQEAFQMDVSERYRLFYAFLY